jgi:hypothetical protein
MKKGIVILTLLLITARCRASFHSAGKAVSAIVLKSFSQQYPDIHVSKWIIVNDTCIARFKMDKRKNAAFYLTNGDWVKTERKISWLKDMPEKVRNSFNRCPYADGYIQSLKEVSLPDGEQFIIAVHYEEGPPESIPGDWTEDYVLHFNKKGILLKKEHFSKG